MDDLQEKERPVTLKDGLVYCIITNVFVRYVLHQDGFHTTVQQRGQNHHMKSRANRRNSTSRVMRRMVPSNWWEDTRGKWCITNTRRKADTAGQRFYSETTGGKNVVFTTSGVSVGSGFTSCDAFVKFQKWQRPFWSWFRNFGNIAFS